MIEKPPQRYGHSASPVLVGGHLLLTLNHLTALDPATGQTVWQTKINPKWGTPVPVRVNDTDAVAMPGGELIQVSDGAILAQRLGDLIYGSPVVTDDMLIYICAKSAAYRMPFEITRQRLTPAWTAELGKNKHYASPVHHEGLIYGVHERGGLYVLDAATGELVYERPLALGGGTYYPSVTFAGEYVYVSSENGTTVVLKPGREYIEVRRNQFEAFRSCMVFRGRRLFIRGADHLYCIEEPKSVSRNDTPDSAP